MFDMRPLAPDSAGVLPAMKTLSLLLMPIASLAFLSNPSEPAVDAAQVNAVLDQPEVRAMVEQLQKAQALLPDGEAPMKARSGSARESGLHTGHLQSATLRMATRVDSAASGLTPADEWSGMFPRYAANRPH